MECPRCSRTGKNRAAVFMGWCPWEDEAGNRVREDWICPRCGMVIIRHTKSGQVKTFQRRKAA